LHFCSEGARAATEVRTRIPEAGGRVIDAASMTYWPGRIGMVLRVLGVLAVVGAGCASPRNDRLGSDAGDSGIDPQRADAKVDVVGGGGAADAPIDVASAPDVVDAPGDMGSPDTAAIDATCGGNTWACEGACIATSAPCAGNCPTGRNFCGNTCVEASNVMACGSACKICPTSDNGTASCNGDTCALTCREGFHRCGDQCVSNIAVATCGSSCTPCPVPTGGTATCDGTKCGATCPTSAPKLCAGACIPTAQACAGVCPAGTHDCGGLCVPNSDAKACGSACTMCPAPNGGDATCASDRCGFQCRTGFHACGAECKDNNSVASCGTRCDACPVPANGTATCQSGQCGFVCTAGRKCGSLCIADSQPCEGACRAGFKLCGNTCIVNTACCAATEPPICTGDNLRSCVGGVVTTKPCPFGCAGSACVACSTPVTCYADNDKDTFGDPAVSKQFCGTCGTGYVSNKSDCYDFNAMAYPRGPVPPDTFEDYFAMHRGDGSFDYTCDGRIETTPGDPAKATCTGVGATCAIVRMPFDPSICGTLVPTISCSCNDVSSSCQKSCRPIGVGSKIQVRCR
jgi:hypothetical protein